MLGPTRPRKTAAEQVVEVAVFLRISEEGSNLPIGNGMPSLYLQWQPHPGSNHLIVDARRGNPRVFRCPILSPLQRDHKTDSDGAPVVDAVYVSTLR
jgi:hypothetical protein